MYQFRQFRKTMLCAFCALPLAACSTSTKTAHPAPAPVAEAASQTTGGDVQVFSLDGPAAAYSGGVMAKNDSIKNRTQGGFASPHDSSVTVYPFDTDTTTAGDAYAAGTQVAAAAPSSVQPQTLTPLPAAAHDPDAPSMPMATPAATQNVGHPYAQPGFEPARIYFAHGRTTLDGSSKAAIKTAAQGAGNGAVQVEGHASARTATSDPVQSHIINLKVSMERAYDVTRELIRDGVPAQTIQTTAWGDTRPALQVGGKSIEDASRRVEIYVSPTPASYTSQ